MFEIISMDEVQRKNNDDEDDISDKDDFENGELILRVKMFTLMIAVLNI